MNQRSFISLTAESAIPFNAEEFSDMNELRALADLIGPYGMKLINETLMWHISSQVQELKVIRDFIRSKQVFYRLNRFINQFFQIRNWFLAIKTFC